MVHLIVRGFKMPFVVPSLLLAIRTHIHAAASAVITHAIHGVMIDDGSVVHVDVGDGHVIDATVVVEPAITPVPALVAVTEVSEAVVDAAVKADVRTPITCMPNIQASIPAPVAGRP